MSLSGALSNAMSGLVANARGTSVISSNIANALNEHYGRREISLSTNATQTSGGVIVAQITRQSDPVLAHQKRVALAEQAAASAHATFQGSLENLVGSIDTVGSLAQKLTGFEAALLSAASDPSSETRLRNVSYAAEDFASGLRKASTGLDRLRERADAGIVIAVDQMNAGLSELDRLNNQIMTAKHLGQDVLGLLDRRDAALDALAVHVPLHVVERDSGAISVFTAQGRTLLDEHAVRIGFTPSVTILPHMTAANGLLSGLTIDGKSLDLPGPALMQGGALEAQFHMRDTVAPDAQRRLDGIARDVIDRFGPAGPDATLGATDAGLFTDAGMPLSPGSEIGLAGRISLSSALTASTVEPWRWRAGINAPSPGDVGQSALLLALRDQVSATLSPGSSALGLAPRSLVDHVHRFASDIGADRIRTGNSAEAMTIRLEDLRQASAEKGVNTDRELQDLIQLEKSYAANARVIQVVDDMLSELLRI